MSQNLWNIGKAITIDSGFWVSILAIAMKESRVFSQALIKPRGKGWLMLVIGKYNDECFSNEQISYCETLDQVVNGVKVLIIF